MLLTKSLSSLGSVKLWKFKILIRIENILNFYMKSLMMEIQRKGKKNYQEESFSYSNVRNDKKVKSPKKSDCKLMSIFGKNSS